MSIPPVLQAALRVAHGLEQVGAQYQVVGSVASSIHGDPRSTNDIDFVVRLSPLQVPDLTQALGPDFDVDTEALQDAMRSHRSWNIFFLPQFIRIDLFALPQTEYDEAAFQRRRAEVIGPEDERLVVQSPEDVVLRKLRWFRDGGEVSSQQWRDVVQVLRVQGAAIELGWLDRWAGSLGVADLVARARQESG